MPNVTQALTWLRGAALRRGEIWAEEIFETLARRAPRGPWPETPPRRVEAIARRRVADLASDTAEQAPLAEGCIEGATVRYEELRQDPRSQLEVLGSRRRRP